MEKSHWRGVNRWGAAGLAFLVGAQSVLANSPEKNYWDQRRADRSAHRSGTLVSRAVSPHSPLPWVDRFPPVQVFRPSLSPSLERSVPKNFLEKHRALLNALSPIYGTVRKVTPAPGFAAGRVVVHIQDVHHNAEAQSNIRGAVADLLKSGRVGVVALEGSCEPIDLQAFADFPHRQPVELAADWLLKENKISGPIHAALTFQGRLPRLLGVDDEKHYAANVQAVRDAARQAGGVRHTIEIARRKLEVDKSRVFSADLSALDKTVNDYRAERISLGAYVETLTARVSMGGRSFRSVDLFLKALKIERSLDFQQVERERKQLVETLTQTLTDTEIETLMAESAAYRSGGRLFGEFYAGLTDLCRRKGVALSAFPAMDEYVRYALMADGIEPDKLLREIQLLEMAAYKALVRTPSERMVVYRSRRLWLASRLVDFALTPPEWEEWGKAKGEFDLTSFEAFYREAQARDKAIAENVGNALADTDVAVLVTGGFHAEGVARLLEQRGVSVISFVPKLTKVDLAQGSSYLSVFSQEKTPLEKLVQGEKLFLSTPPIAKEIRRIQLPVVVTLLGMLLAIQIDPQLTYALLGGLGDIKDVVAGSGLAQALVVVGAGALVFRVITKGGKVDVVSSPERPGFATTFKIKFWDPVREQVLYFFPAVILVPSLLTLLVTTTFGGGVGMALATFLIVDVIGVLGAVVILLGLEHKGYSQKQKEALVGPALKIGVLTLAGFVVSMVLLSPSVLGLVSYTDQFFSWMPAGEWKAFFLSALAGNLSGVWKHFDHNEKTFMNYLQWKKNENSDVLLPLSLSAAGPVFRSEPRFASYSVTIPEDMGGDKAEFFRWVNLWLSKLSTEPNERFRQVSLFVTRLRQVNPGFCDDNPNLVDVHSLSNDLALLKYVINAAIFLPLHSNAAFSQGELSPIHGEFDPRTWRGSLYLGQEIWWVKYKETSNPKGSGLHHGFGFISEKSHEDSSRNFVLWIKNGLSPSHGFNWQWLRKYRLIDSEVRQAIAMLLEGSIVEYLKMHAFTRLSLGPNRMLFAPTIESMAKAIVRPRGPAFQMNLSSGMLIDAEGQLSVLSDVVSSLKINNRNELAVLVFYYWMGLHLRRNPESSATGLLRMLQSEGIGTMDDLRTKIAPRETAAKKQVDVILKFLEDVHDKSFITYSERFAGIYGASPLAGQPQLSPIGGHIKIPEPQKAREVTPVIQEPATTVSPTSAQAQKPNSSTAESLIRDIEDNPSKYSPLNVLIRLAKAQVDDEQVKTRLNQLIETYLPLVLTEMQNLETGILQDNLEPGSVSDVLLTVLKSMQVITSIGTEAASNTGNSLEQIKQTLRQNLLNLITASQSPAKNLLTYSKALELDALSADFLRKYVGIQGQGKLPTIEDIADGVDESSVERALQIYEGLVRLLGDQNQLPLSFDEDVEDVPDAEMPEGGLAPFYDQGYRVVVFKDHYDKNVANNNPVQKAIVNVVGNLVNRRETGERDIVVNSRGGLYSRGVHKKRSSGQKVFIKIVGEKTIVVFWVDSEDKAHGRQSFTANKEVDQRIASQVDNLAIETDNYVLLNPDFSVDETADLSKFLQNPQTGNGRGASGAKSNSLLYLVSGRPGLGIGGAGVEAIFLLLGTSILGGVGMGFFLLPLFSLAHVWIIARQNPGMSVAQLVQQFVWHYLLALPYALIGFSSVQEILGGENAAQFFAASWHLLTDAVFMIHDKISARKAAQRTMDALLPPAGSLRIEQVGGARWTQDVRPQLFRPGFARAYEKALARQLLKQPKGSFPAVPARLVEWLESSFTGTPATAEGQKIYVQAVDGQDLDDAVRSAQIVQGWADRGLDAPRLVLAAKETAVLAKLRAVARSGVVDVVDEPVADKKGVLNAALLLESLNRFQISPSARLSVMVSASISVNEAVLDQLNGDLADQFREALLAIIKGDPIRHRDFRIFLEVASEVLESA